MMRKDKLGEAMNEYADESLQMWRSAFCDDAEGDAEWTYAALIYASFDRWQEANKRIPVSRKALCMALERDGCMRWKIGALRVFRGISLRGCAGDLGKDAAQQIKSKRDAEREAKPVSGILSPQTTGMTWQERSAIRSKLAKDEKGRRVYPADWPYSWR